jgi:hypothetical protein
VDASDSAATSAGVVGCRSCSGADAAAADEAAAGEAAAGEAAAGETAAGETVAGETAADETADIPPERFAACSAAPSDPSSSDRMSSGSGKGGGIGVRATPLAISDFLLARAIPPLSVDRRLVIAARVSGVGVWDAPAENSEGRDPPPLPTNAV